VLGHGLLVDAARVRPALARLWNREMPRRVYEPRLVLARLRGGRLVRALAFLADPEHPSYVRELDLHGRARLVAQASGFGPCVDYIQTRSPICTTSVCAIPPGAGTPRGPRLTRESESMNLWASKTSPPAARQPAARAPGEVLRRAAGDRVERLGEDAWRVAGRHRRLVIGRGTAGAVPYFALQMQDAGICALTRARSSSADCAARRHRRLFFADGACTVSDPDGRRIVFGLPEETCGENGLPAAAAAFCLRHDRLPEMVKFYGGSRHDRIRSSTRNDSLAACFLR